MTQLPPEAIAALERGHMIEAIKIVRERTGKDLKSSKEAVDRHVHRVAVATCAPAAWLAAGGRRAAARGSGVVVFRGRLTA